MNLEAALNQLIDQWEEARPYFSADARSQLADLIGRIVPGVRDPHGPAAADALAAVSELSDLLWLMLPAGHPVREAFDATRSLAVLSRGADSAEELLRRLEAEPAGPDAPPRPEEVMSAVIRRLLGVPALSVADLEDFGVDPDAPGLIRLTRLDGAYRWPDFQFGPDRRPLAVVVRINEFLEAHEDPWGAADWWLGGNTWLGAAPAALLGKIPDDTLVAAARAVDPGV
ncbi:hypothetical protein J5X84_31470 [Streptosporangiaceae bacterium NEAU-GS5]|nr:hypothetical protein [Streptosporangiaceae bacterium NEAU-GS5]